MSRLRSSLTHVATVVVALAAATPLAAQEYQKATSGTRVLEAPSGLTIKMLVEAANLGGDEVEVGEITIPAHSEPQRGHAHHAVEILYVLSGTLEHVVNGESHVLSPGMVGIVRPGDEVMHRVPGDLPVKALVIWAPGGEAARLAPGFKERRIGG